MGFLQNHPNLLNFSVIDYSIIWQLSDQQVGCLDDLPDPWEDEETQPEPLPCVRRGFGPGTLPAELKLVPKLVAQNTEGSAA
jgi:hypothetical protein